MNNFPNKIATLCIEKYNALKKTGKPTDNEWTILSGIILKTECESLSVVSLATGTKCVGGLELIKTPPHERGSKLSDSHAEILARRAFLRYLYDQIDIVLSGFKSNILFLNEENKLEMYPSISFHFFSSQSPCGDCSIFPKNDIDEEECPAKIRKTMHNDQEKTALELSVIETNRDIHRTGAKCLKTERYQDPKLPGADYHTTGPLRTKPGRGDPTLSLSCSDKMAKWNVIGIQGSLLSLFISQIKLESITIGNGCPFSLEAMERGLCKRFSNKLHVPQIFQADIAFAHRKEGKRINPCSSSIIWCAVRKSELEIAVQGRKQGITKKKKGHNLLVSRRELLKICLQICDKYQNIKTNIFHPKKITYYDCKQWAFQYQSTWNQLKKEVFVSWPGKPLYLQDFIL
ncbi:tRNA-specific adenosine deaminase 1 [Polistes fuscatus]|uniref:tRNA-specific adenosine deaminase 1 n=1 Tax=Polistes fuscatus TaxID=30207 RepID=UPI001CA7BF4E|nr:tRNA-specific adenosine deaminase 1 [Polistes fuscatus]